MELNFVFVFEKDYHFDKEEELMPHYPRGYMGVAKDGRPIYIELLGQLNPTEVFNVVDPDTMWLAWYKSFEVLQKRHFMVCSLIA